MRYIQNIDCGDMLIQLIRLSYMGRESEWEVYQVLSSICTACTLEFERSCHILWSGLLRRKIEYDLGNVSWFE